jgi:putative ABC transport system permease protein
MAGIGVAFLALQVALTVMPTEMTTRSFNAIALDWHVVALTMGTGFVTSVLFGLPPAFMASRTTVADVLRRDTRSSTGSALARQLRSVLVIAEVSLSIVLLVGAALMTRSFVKLQSIDKGLDPAGLISLRLGLPAAGYADVVQPNHSTICVSCDQFLQAAVDRVRHLPGVIGVTIGTVPPQIATVQFGHLEIGNHAEPAGAVSITSLYQVPPDFFSTLRIPFLEGRTFSDADPDGASIVSVDFAKKHWPEGHPIGGQFRFNAGDPWMTVVGVAATVRDGAGSNGTDRAQMYVPFGRPFSGARPVRPTSTIGGFRTLVVRASNPAAVSLLLPGAIHSIDPKVVIDKREFVEHQFADAIAKPRIVFLMMSVFAVFALVLAAAGIYGVLSCLVQQRLREIGIRLALGASPREVGRLIFQNGLGLTAVGVAGGVVLALALMRTLRTLLYEIAPTDPVSVTAVAALLLLTAAAAAWRPARRAMSVDPVRLLRED